MLKLTYLSGPANLAILFDEGMQIISVEKDAPTQLNERKAPFLDPKPHGVLGNPQKLRRLGNAKKPIFHPISNFSHILTPIKYSSLSYKPITVSLSRSILYQYHMTTFSY